MAKKHEKHVTQKMVADELGVHFTTVSAALRGRSNIPEKTKEKIIKTAQKMGYVPNAMARGLRTRKSGLVAMIGDLRFSPNIAPRVSCMANLLHQRGHELMFFHAPERGESSENLIKSLTSHWISAVIVAGAFPAIMPKELENWLRQIETKLFMMSWLPFIKNVIDVDRAEGVRIAVEHLVKLGHRRIAMSCWLTPPPLPVPRVMGWRKATQQYGLENPDHWILEYMLDRDEENFEAMKKLANMNPRPTALICDSDENAMLCTRLLFELGLRVPEDISIIGRDGINAAKNNLIPITTLLHPVEALSHTLVDKLINMIKRECESEFDPILIPPILEVRASTAPPAGN